VYCGRLRVDPRGVPPLDEGQIVASTGRQEAACQAVLTVALSLVVRVRLADRLITVHLGSAPGA
jgi:hypothetical protein